jgi:lathosterol oxidase
MDFLTAPIFMAQVHGYSKLYENVDDYGWGYLVFSIIFFFFFTGECNSCLD